MLKKVYSCDICSDEKEPIDLLGLRFSNNTDFVIGYAQSTDGKHICIDCLVQIRHGELPKMADDRLVQAIARHG
jgi:hypothetical protein